jgi:hypothetical protein
MLQRHIRPRRHRDERLGTMDPPAQPSRNAPAFTGCAVRPPDASTS